MCYTTPKPKTAGTKISPAEVKFYLLASYAGIFFQKKP